MRFFESRNQHAEHQKLVALDRSLAIIEFSPDGTILRANENFCRALGYGGEDLAGRHHRMFLPDDLTRSPEYPAFWRKLAGGAFDSGTYMRVRKDGQPVYIEATYNPVFGSDGKVASVLKVAADVTKTKLQAMENGDQLKALSLVQGVIQFSPGGVVLDANDNFSLVMGYGLDEIVGRHHRMFVDDKYAKTPEYEDFWRKLRSGVSEVDSFHRIGAGGKPVWLQAAYCPIRDLTGNVVKVTKFAYDMTDLLTLATGLSALARRDLRERLTKPFTSAFDKLRIDFNGAVENLEGAIAAAAGAADNVHASVDEIATGVTDLSQRSESQAASLEESAAALAEVTKAVGQTAQNAQLANALVGKARDDARKAGEIVTRAVDAMGRIERSSKEIANIIGVIDEIAFQTNLLALNAGVEAARAGDAGRGFAVVAMEVRALAQRSADAARQIKTLISASGADVNAGVGLVQQTGEALGAIVVKVAQVNGLVANIAGTTNEQRRSLDEVNIAVGQMDQATQQNAAIADQSTAAVQSMRDQVERLNETMKQFAVSKSSSADERTGSGARPSRSHSPGARTRRVA
jgi:methyl-accepting chemotaxis protein